LGRVGGHCPPGSRLAVGGAHTDFFFIGEMVPARKEILYLATYFL